MATLITGLEGFMGQVLLLKLPGSWFPLYGTAAAAIPAASRNDVHYEPLDITDARALERFVGKIKPERIVHLAAQSSVGLSLENPRVTFQTNTGGSLNLLEAARKHCPACVILLISSSEVYGENELGRGFVETDPLDPLSPYAASKAAMEVAGMAYGRSFGMDIRIARSFNHTGPGQNERFIFPYLAKTLIRIKRGKAPPLLEVGNLDLHRDYLDVRDVAGAYLAILEKGRANGVYNVAGGRGRSLRFLVEELIRVSGLRVEIQLDKKRERSSEILKSYGDCSLLSDMTGWKPSIDLSKTFKDMLQYWEDRSSA